MGIVASELIAAVTVEGIDTAETQMVAMGAASDAAATALATSETAAAAWTATMREAGLEAFTFDAATGQFVSNMAESEPVMAAATASTDAWRSAAEMAAMTAQGMADAFAVDTAATDTMNASMLAAIPTVGQLDAQFAAMRANFASTSAQIDVQQAAMMRSAKASIAAKESHAAFAKELKNVGNVAKDVIVTLGTIALVTGAIAAIIGIIAVKAAADFQQGLNRLVTGAGDVTDNMQKMGQAILGVSADTGVMTGPLLSAMYMIISAGQRGAQAQNTLAVAARGAVAEQAKVVDVAKALTGAMTNYGTAQFNAVQFMNGFTRAVQLGKLSLEQLSVSMGPLLPIAKNLGIHFADVAAAMSTMTNAEIPADRAATSLRFLFQSLENPTKKALTAMKEFGLNSVAVANEMKVSLPGALQMIYDAAKKAGPEGSVPFNRAVSDMIGGQRSLQAFLSLTGSHMKTFRDDAKAVADAMGVSKTAVLGWDVAQKNFNVQLDKAKAALAGLFITIGDLLLPKLTELLANIVPLIKSFTDWFASGDQLRNGLKIIGDILKPLGPAIHDIWTQIQPTVQQFADWAVKNDVAGKTLAFAKVSVQALADTLRFLVPVVVQIIAAIVQFIATLIDRMMPTISAVVTFIQAHWLQIGAITQGLWNWISGIISAAWAYIKGIIFIALDLMQGKWSQAWTDMKDMLAGIWAGIKKAAIGGVEMLLGVLALIPGGIGDMAKKALKELQRMTNDINTATEQWQKAALQHSIAMQQGVVDNLKKMAAGVEAQMKNAKTAAEKQALEQQLAVINSAIATNEGVLKQYQAMAGGVNTAMSKMTASVTSHADQMKQQAVQKAREMSNQLVGGSIIPDMVNKIVSVFGTLPGRVMSAVSSLGGQLAGFFNNLASQAVSWGLHIIQNLAAGIAAGIGAATQAAQNVADAVKKILGHSKPEEGPMRDDDVWGLHFAQNIAQGIRAGIPQVQSALAMMLGGTGMGGGLNLGVSGSFGGSSIPAFFGGGGSGTTIVHVHPVVQADMYVDGRLVSRQLGPHLASEMWSQNGGSRLP